MALGKDEYPKLSTPLGYFPEGFNPREITLVGLTIYNYIVTFTKSVITLSVSHHSVCTSWNWWSSRWVFSSSVQFSSQELLVESLSLYLQYSCPWVRAVCMKRRYSRCLSESVLDTHTVLVIPNCLCVSASRYCPLLTKARRRSLNWVATMSDILNLDTVQ
jgi:hypothetical protein